MKILLLAPQPFYVERGTPIAVDLLARALSMQGHDLDILVFPGGEDKTYTNTRLHRLMAWPRLRDVKPGFSAKKLYLDLWMFFHTWKLLRKNNYDVVHAIEESAFIALFLRPFYKFKTICDIDSSMTTQIVDRFAWLRFAEKALRSIEHIPAVKAHATVPMCEALAAPIREKRGNEGIFVLQDIDLTSLDTGQSVPADPDDDPRSHFDNPDLPLLTYIGNLESYQGIDLLLDSLALLENLSGKLNAVLIGGAEQDIGKYRLKCYELGMHPSVKLVGPRPVSDMAYYMRNSDLLVSPRTQGINTPMKIYSYLASGTPVLATRQQTHTQVVTEEIAFMADPDADSFSAAIEEAISNPGLGKIKAGKAKDYIQEHHSFEVFSRTVRDIYNYVGAA